MRTTHQWFTAVMDGAFEALVLRVTARQLEPVWWVIRVSWCMERQMVRMGDPAAIQWLLPTQLQFVVVLFMD